MPAARKFTNQLQAIGEQLFGALAKGAMGAGGGAGGVQLLGDISFDTLLALGAATAVWGLIIDVTGSESDSVESKRIQRMSNSCPVLCCNASRSTGIVVGRGFGDGHG